MTRLKSNMFFIFSIFLMSCHVTLSFNPLATAKVLGYFASVEARLKTADAWKKLIESFIDDGVTKGDILKEVKLVSDQINDLSIKLDDKIGEATLRIPARVRADSKIDVGVRDLLDRMENIDFIYEMYFMKILNKQADSIMQGEFVDKVLKLDSGPFFEIHKIYRLLHRNRTATLSKGLLGDIKDKIQMINLERCNEDYSPQYWLFNMYINVMVTEIRAYIMTTIAYAIDEERQNVSRKIVISSNTEEFLTRVEEHMRVFREELASTPRDIRRCDPSNHIRGETFIEFERLTQLYLVNEDMFPDRRPCNYCSGIPRTPGDLLRTDYRYKRFHYPEFRKCNGFISNCGRLIERIHDGEVCLLPENGTRDYSWVKIRPGPRFLGIGPDCDGKTVDLLQHLRPLWNSHNMDSCQFCVCDCASEDPVLTIRSVSVRQQESKINLNMVVTGVRLVEKNRIVHIQIKEGKLISGGKIEPGSESWVPLEEMDFINRKIVEIGPNNTRTERKLARGTDYEFLSDRSNNFIIEDLMAPKGEVIVGIKFQNMLHPSQNFDGIGLELKTAPFNWTTGEVGNGRWRTRSLFLVDLAIQRSQTDNTFYPRYTDIPTKSKENFPYLSNAIVQFQMTDVYKDFGQTVVPFLDSLPVEGNPGFPLGGIGLFYKTKGMYGGFISPRIHNVDYSDYMSIQSI